MNFFDLAVMGLAITLLVLCYFDINSTEAVLKRGTGYEANPLVAWLQKTFPTGWVYIKAGWMVFLAILVIVFLPVRWAITVLFILDVIYYVVVQSNYAINS
jgi:hypothetical protein